MRTYCSAQSTTGSRGNLPSVRRLVHALNRLVLFLPTTHIYYYAQQAGTEVDCDVFGVWQVFEYRRFPYIEYLPYSIISHSSSILSNISDIPVFRDSHVPMFEYIPFFKIRPSLLMFLPITHINRHAPPVLVCTATSFAHHALRPLLLHPAPSSFYF